MTKNKKAQAPIAWVHFTTAIQLLFNFFKKNMFPLVKMKFALFYVTESKETAAGFPGEGPGLQAWTLVLVHSRLESPQTSRKTRAFT